MAINILPYDMGSKSAQLLASVMGVKRIRLTHSAYKHRKDNVIINWGCTERPPHIPEDALVLNPFSAIKQTTDSINAYERMREYGIDTPWATTDVNEAIAWLGGGHSIIGKKYKTGKAILIEHDNDIPICDFYTRYIKKKSEYRVHVAKGKVLSIGRKVLSNGCKIEKPSDWYIRTGENGFDLSYWNESRKAAEMDICPPRVGNQAVNALESLSLHFGSVDVIWNDKHKTPYVLSVNPIPTLDGELAHLYAEVLGGAYNEEVPKPNLGAPHWNGRVVNVGWAAGGV